MRPSFHPRLINGPFDDPGLFIPFQFQNRAVIFDLGDINCLPAKDILKISHAFVSHTHMDHFIGFDRLLRLTLGREKNLSLYGPPGFLKNVEGKLAGYTWNLADKYNYPLSLADQGSASAIHAMPAVTGAGTGFSRFRIRSNSRLTAFCMKSRPLQSRPLSSITESPVWDFPSRSVFMSISSKMV